MTEQLANHPSVIRFANSLAGLGLSRDITYLQDSARTAKEAADALGIEVGQVCSSLIFVLDEKPLLILTSGRHRVDTKLVAGYFGYSDLGRANAEMVREATGYAIGGVAPIGHPTPLPTLIDQALSEYEILWAAAGHPHAVFPLTFSELKEITQGEIRFVGEG